MTDKLENVKLYKHVTAEGKTVYVTIPENERS